MTERFLPDRIIGWNDIAWGVGQLIVDEAKLAFHAVFRMPRQLASHGDHFPQPQFDQSGANLRDLEVMVNGGLMTQDEATQRHIDWLLKHD